MWQCVQKFIQHEWRRLKAVKISAFRTLSLLLSVLITFSQSSLVFAHSLWTSALHHSLVNLEIIFLRRSNRDKPRIVTVDNFMKAEYNLFKPHLETKFLIHGYLSSGYSSAIQNMKDAYLDASNLNVIGACLEKYPQKMWITFNDS